MGAQNQASASRAEGRRLKHAAKDARKDQKEMWKEIRKYFAPWRHAGVRSLEDLERIQGQYEAAIQDPNEYIKSPGFEWLKQQGISAIDRGAAARGKLDSGQNQKDLIAYGQGLASQDYGRYLGRLENLMDVYARTSQMGQNAAAQTAQYGQRAVENMGNWRIQGAGGDAAGQIGAANAQTGFYNNLANIGSNAAEQYLFYNALNRGNQDTQTDRQRERFDPSWYGGG
jgi:hypothetical protein